jgi:replicative DNA helicase
LEIVAPDDFFGSDHRTVMNILADKHARGEKFDAVTVANGLVGKLDEDPWTLLGRCMDPEIGESTFGLLWREHAHIVRKKVRLRRLLVKTFELERVSSNGAEPAEVHRITADIEAEANAYISEVSTARARMQVFTARQICELPDPPGEDELLGPLVVRGQRLVLGAHTGHGKTTFTLQTLRAIVDGEQFLDWTGAGGRALVIDAEQGLPARSGWVIPRQQP